MEWLCDGIFFTNMNHIYKKLQLTLLFVIIFFVLTQTLDVPEELLLGLRSGGGGGAGRNRRGVGVKYSSPSPSSPDDCVGEGDGGDKTRSS